jgi:hypothetical protein
MLDVSNDRNERGKKKLTNPEIKRNTLKTPINFCNNFQILNFKNK